MTRLAQLLAAKRSWLAAERAEGRNPTGMTPCNDEPFIRLLAETELRSEIQQAWNHARGRSEPLPRTNPETRRKWAA